MKKKSWLFPGGMVVEARTKSEARGVMKARLQVMGYPPPVRLPKGLKITETRPVAADGIGFSDA